MFCDDISLDVKNFMSMQIKNDNELNDKPNKQHAQPMETDQFLNKSADLEETKKEKNKMVVCEFCGDDVPATKIVLHITRKKKCLAKCGQDRLNDLKRKKALETKMYQRKYSKENAEKEINFFFKE